MKILLLTGLEGLWKEIEHPKFANVTVRGFVKSRSPVSFMQISGVWSKHSQMKCQVSVWLTVAHKTYTPSSAGFTTENMKIRKSSVFSVIYYFPILLCEFLLEHRDKLKSATALEKVFTVVWLAEVWQSSVLIMLLNMTPVSSKQTSLKNVWRQMCDFRITFKARLLLNQSAKLNCKLSN